MHVYFVLQSTFNMITIYYNETISLREKMIFLLLSAGTFLHTRLYLKRKPWHLNAAKLAQFPLYSLGRKMSEFYQLQKFEPIPKAENHDVFHLLLGFSTSVKEETCMQFVLAGNGKRSPFTIGTCILSLLLFPENFSLYRNCFKKGKRILPFTHLNFRQLLSTNLNQLKSNLQII